MILKPRPAGFSSMRESVKTMKFVNKYYYVIMSVLIVATDQITKLMVRQNFDYLESVPIISNVFYLTYFRNPGAGMGIPIPRWWLVGLTALIIAGFIYIIVKRSLTNVWAKTAIAFMLGGAFGNLIDRVVPPGYVVDFFDFSHIGFPFVFNIADIFVVVGAVLLIVYTVFLSRDKEKENGTQN